MTLTAGVLLTHMILSQLPTSTGTHELQIETGEVSMRYALSLPKGYTPEGSPRPLVLALHYAGHGAPYYGKGMLTGFVEPGLRELGAVIVAPDCPAASWSSPVAEEAVLALLDELTESLPIDATRVVVTGYSLGGMGTWNFISRHPDRFSAAIPMAGAPRSADLDAAAKTPIYAIHSRVDDIVPLDPTKEAIEQLQKRGADATLVVVDDVPHYESFRFRDQLAETVDWLEKLWSP